MNINYSKLSLLRNLARATGLVRLLSLPGQIRRSIRKREYERNKPAVTTIGIGAATAQMHTENLYEWMRVQSFRDDRHIIAAVAKHLKPGDVCWDIGASIGLYSVLLGKAVGPNGQVVSFEPENRSREKLLANTTLNRMPQVKVVPVALGREKGTFDLVLATDASAGTHQMVTSANPDNKSNVQSVEVWPGDAFRAAPSNSAKCSEN